MWPDDELRERAEWLCVLSEQVRARHVEVMCQVREWDRMRLEWEQRREHRRSVLQAAASPNVTGG